MDTFDVVVVGGGPAGATAATDLAAAGRSVLLLDRAGRIKPCGGAVPPRLMDQFEIPDDLLVARVGGAEVIAPSSRRVTMPIDSGYVGMVDREVFDAWLRRRAAAHGAECRQGTFTRIERDDHDGPIVAYVPKGQPHDATPVRVRARAVIGADGAVSAVGRQEVPGADKTPFVFAYHEVVRSPSGPLPDYAADRCGIFYNGTLSPDFYAWIFPHGDTASIGTGSASKGFPLRSAIDDLRRQTGLDGVETIRREGAPIPMRPLKRWDNGRDVVLAGDAAGVVAPASGEGIYYAMLGGRLAAEAVHDFCTSADPSALRLARKRFMKVHGPVFWMLGVMQKYWYSNDGRRERFVSICRDRDVQQLTWEAYMQKELVRAKPLAHVRIFFKNIAHLTGLVSA